MAKIIFTATKIQDHTCPPDKKQAFIWDVTAKGLGLRATTAGKPAYIFQGEYQGKTVRVTIGSPDVWQLDDSKRKTPGGNEVIIQGARSKARELQRMIDQGQDPRSLKADAVEQAQAKATEKAAKIQQEAAQALTVGEVWTVYVEERRPHWGDLHYRDHIRKAAPGGVPSKRGTRGKGVTSPGPLYSLMALPLRDLTAPVVEAWAVKEAKTRPTSARLAWRMLKVFLGWCEEQAAYAALMPPKNQAKTKKTREALGKAGVKSDSLQREQLAVWFAAVKGITNPVISAYLQTLLLTGARPGEVIAMQWDDLNTKWKGITIRDKVEGERVIPLTPYVSQLLAALPRRNDWVFSSASKSSKAGHVSEPNYPHSTACKVAGIDGLTLHGLRRSFKSLTEWLEIPAGVVAQLMGHKPSATAEKHYTVRPLDLLRVHHEKIEAWILEQAGVTFDAKAEPGKLRVVAG
ncbi:MAG: preprotein translocase [Rhodoferax ferrireducens]|uniref:Preprotein translocase n=1 Tax=Rhodoferax ferrireducens TaxID=192843 RepID=A0A1W9KPS7_9BURK|nr:MAG: preprotein translocase [Rhodoferax ferrireducens]